MGLELGVEPMVVDNLEIDFAASPSNGEGNAVNELDGVAEMFGGKVVS